MSKVLRLLLIQAVDADAEAILDALRQGGIDVDAERIRNRPELIEALERRTWHAVIADIAGGHGQQLADILAATPGAKGILFDQAHVVAGAPALLAACGVADRCQVVAGSFFDSVPPANAYVLKHILHDWYDDDCRRILETIRRSAPPGVRLLVIERIIEGPNLGANGKSSDLNMLVGPGGLERTQEEFETLLSSAGWKPIAAHPAATHHIIECELA